MKPRLVAILALIAAAQARVAGMQAENERRTSCGHSLAYGAEAFQVEANHLETLSIEARNVS